MPKKIEQLMSKKDLAKRLRCSQPTINRLLRNGLLSCVRIGRQIRFRESDVAEYLSRNEHPAWDYQ
jgi:excisionase family DNA binding protein